MERISVISTLLAWVGYLPQQHLLEIGFRSGDIYDYRDVPPEVYQQLLAAGSKGNFFNLHIRNRFPTLQVHRRVAS